MGQGGNMKVLQKIESLLSDLWIHPVIGIDISASAVKMVELVPSRNGKFKLKNYVIEPLSKGIMNNEAIQDTEALSATIHQAWLRLKTKTKQVVYALPISSVVTSTIGFPEYLSYEEIYELIEEGLEKYTSIPAEEVFFDFKIIGPSKVENSAELEIILSVSRKEHVESMAEIINNAELKLCIVDIDPYAANPMVERALKDQIKHKGKGSPEDACVAFFDIGSISTQMIVYERGDMVYSQERMMGGNQLTKAIMDTFDLSEKESELRKINGDLPDNYNFEVFMPYVMALSVEINRNIQLFYTATTVKHIDAIALIGGGAIQAAIAEEIKEVTSIPCYIIDPFQGMEIDSRIDMELLQQHKSMLFKSTGLALRGKHYV